MDQSYFPNTLLPQSLAMNHIEQNEIQPENQLILRKVSEISIKLYACKRVMLNCVFPFS